MESIMLTVKKALDVEADYEGFDSQIIMAINTAIFNLSQLGVGPAGGYVVETVAETWTELFAGVDNLEAIKSYILLSVKMEFDTPSTSFGINALESQINQLAWRIQVQVEPEV